MWSPLYVRQTSAMTTAPAEVPFHQIAVTACHTSVELGEVPWNGFYVDVFDRREQWNSTTSHERLQTVRIFKRPRFPSAYMVLSGGKLVVLIGSDDSGQLAFDVWEPRGEFAPSTKGYAHQHLYEDPSKFGLLVNNHYHGYSALSWIPNFLAKAFEPQPSGRLVTKMRYCNVEVLVDKFYEGQLPVHDLKIVCTKKVVEQHIPAATSAPTKSKEARKGLFGYRQRRAQEPSPG